MMKIVALGVRITPAASAIYKSSVQLNLVQDRPDSHLAFSPWQWLSLVDLHNAKENSGMLYF